MVSGLSTWVHAYMCACSYGGQSSVSGIFLNHSAPLPPRDKVPHYVKTIHLTQQVGQQTAGIAFTSSPLAPELGLQVFITRFLPRFLGSKLNSLSQNNTFKKKECSSPLKSHKKNVQGMSPLENPLCVYLKQYLATTLPRRIPRKTGRPN